MTSSALDGLVHDRGARGQAWFSPDREHRYLLLRGGDLDAATPLVAYVMLNPSTADADVNDRTITKCIKFAMRFGVERGLFDAEHGADWPPLRVAVVNLFAVRATDPDVAFAHPRPVGGGKNNDVIRAVARQADLVVAAWGADPRSQNRAREVYRLLRDAVNHRGERVVLHRLGAVSKGCCPKHPLYLRDSTELEIHSW